MSIFKSSYKDPKTGQPHQTQTWYVRFRDHRHIVRRIAAFRNKTASQELDRRVGHLVSLRVSGASLDQETIRWIESLPPQQRKSLIKIHLLDARLAAAGKPLSQHAEDFEASLTARGNTADYVKMKMTRIRRIVGGCGFRHWSDVSASKVEAFLAGLREGTKGIGSQTSNFYLSSFKSFARWMVKDRRAADPIVDHLPMLNVRTDRRHDRRALSVEEMCELLDSTATGPVRGRVSGEERALLYQFAAETGLRAGEIRSLQVGHFRLDGQRPYFSLAAKNTKNRKADKGFVRTGMVNLLKKHFFNKLPNAAAFRMPAPNNLAKVLRADLLGARQKWLDSFPDDNTRQQMAATDFLAYKNDEKLFADFHAFRHVTGSFLAQAGVTPKVAQAILRHSDYRLTMNLYSHSYRQDEVEAIERLPNLSRRFEADGVTLRRNPA